MVFEFRGHLGGILWAVVEATSWSIAVNRKILHRLKLDRFPVSGVHPLQNSEYSATYVNPHVVTLSVYRTRVFTMLLLSVSI